MRHLGGAVALMALTLGGCGTTVPRMASLGQTDEQHYVDETNMVSFIRCELRAAVWEALAKEARTQSSDIANRSDWLRGWGAKISLKLVVEERSAASPGFTFNNTMRNVVLTFPNGPVTVGQAQNTAIGATLGSTATRTETIGFWLPFSLLLEEVETLQARPGAPTDAYASCEPRGAFLRGDLQLDQFLGAKLETAQTSGLLNRAEGRSPYETLIYQTAFVITRSGSLTPSWKLVHFSANPTAAFISGSRVETHDLTITMGPNPVTGPDQSVLNAHLAAQIGSEVARALSARQP